jgi:predicted MPP superfamily phosphohydrolase
VTPERFWLAALLFHAAVLTTCWRLLARWRDRVRTHLPARAWWSAVVRDIALLAGVTYVVSVVATVVANLDYGRRLALGEISVRLLGQALFGEAILLGITVGVMHLRMGRRLRAIALTGTAATLLAVYVEAYRVEPNSLSLRRHHVDKAGSVEGSRVIRILHLTDIQTPVIGPHEERALSMGMAAGPHLIVLTGDYVQNALGRPTERQATEDLRALMARIHFRAPFGVFATDGDAGPPCRDVFAGTEVRCLVDESAIVALPEGDTLKVTGLSRGRGRERDAGRLASVLGRAPTADHHLVISHAPDFVDVAPASIDLVLAGHTHGGQVVLPVFGPPHTASRLPRRFAGGLHEYRGIPLHVSRGVGMERGFAPPVRFLCPPEVCLLDVRWPVAGRVQRDPHSSFVPQLPQ